MLTTNILIESAPISKMFTSAHSMIVSALAVDELIHDMHASYDLDEPAPFPECLSKTSTPAHSIIVSVLTAEGLIHNMPTLHNLVESASSPPKKFTPVYHMIISVLAEGCLDWVMFALHSLTDVSAPAFVSPSLLFTPGFSHNLVDKFILLAESLNTSPTTPTSPATTAIMIANSFLLPEEVVSCLSALARRQLPFVLSNKDQIMMSVPIASHQFFDLFKSEDLVFVPVFDLISEYPPLLTMSAAAHFQALKTSTACLANFMQPVHMSTNFISQHVPLLAVSSELLHTLLLHAHFLPDSSCPRTDCAPLPSVSQEYTGFYTCGDHKLPDFRRLSFRTDLATLQLKEFKPIVSCSAPARPVVPGDLRSPALRFSLAFFRKVLLLPLTAPTQGCAYKHLPFPQPLAMLYRPPQLFPAQVLRVLDFVPQDLPSEVDRSELWCHADALLDVSFPKRLQPPATMFPARAFHARPPPNGWLLDSGASTLITSRKADMFGMAPGKFPISALASTESASARGTVCLQFAPDKFISMPALLVENATTNLVPFSPFIEAVYSIVATNDGAVIFDEESGEILCRAPADKSGMFWLTAVAVPLPGHSAKTARPTALPLHASTHDVWHARLNHPSERTLHEMARHNMVIGLVFAKKHKEEFPCLACLHGRMTYGPVTSPGPHLLRTVKDLPHDTLDVVFVDVYGPVRTSSAGYRYIILSYIGSCRVLRVDKLKTLVFASMQAWFDRLRTRLSKETIASGLRILCIHSDSVSTFVALSELMPHPMGFTGIFHAHPSTALWLSAKFADLWSPFAAPSCSQVFLESTGCIYSQLSSSR